jgi:hypothetical protein
MTTPRTERPAPDDNHAATQHITSERFNGRFDGTGREEFTAWLTASCQRQNLPVTITDPTALAAVAALLRQAHPPIAATTCNHHGRQSYE